MSTKATKTDSLIKFPTDISAQWLGQVLNLDAPEIRSVTRIGTGQMSQSHRVAWTDGDVGGTVVVKLASDDDTSRRTGVRMGAYSREVDFYRHLADRIGEPVPNCHLAEYDDAEGWFTLVLEDIADGVQGDQIAGCSTEQARLAVRELAAVHAPVINDMATGALGWLNLPSPLTQDLLARLLPGFLERYADRVAPEHAEVCRRFSLSADAWQADLRAPLGLVHGDYRLDNLLFTENACTVVDWQTVTWGPAIRDVSYFLGGSLTVEDRRAHERDLVTVYHQELLRLGVQNFSFEGCWEEYRRQVFLGVLMAVVASMVVVQTERGDDMFMVALERACQQALDLSSVDLLPTPGEKLPALQPVPEDEHLHIPGPEPLWNESYYFDAINDTATVGVYLRLGRLPNRGESMYLGGIVRPNKPALMIVDATAPLPDENDPLQTVRTSLFTATKECVTPLQTQRLTVTGTAASHDDVSSPLRGEAGQPVEIAIDLTWETAGVPYQWRTSTRYEVPCRVTGTVTIDGEVVEFAGPGQRDHSYGVRDWWANNWMWSAFELEDGTRTHTVTVPEIPGFAVGYFQNGHEVTEIATGKSETSFTDNGLVSSATIDSGPGFPELTVEPLAFGCLQLKAPDGRVTNFPRAMARVRTGDGRTGLGWIEWNRNPR